MDAKDELTKQYGLDIVEKLEKQLVDEISKYFDAQILNSLIPGYIEEKLAKERNSKLDSLLGNP